MLYVHTYNGELKIYPSILSQVTIKSSIQFKIHNVLFLMSTTILLLRFRDILREKLYFRIYTILIIFKVFV